MPANGIPAGCLSARAGVERLALVFTMGCAIDAVSPLRAGFRFGFSGFEKIAISVGGKRSNILQRRQEVTPLQ
jgi:hypothetical protein